MGRPWREGAVTAARQNEGVRPLRDNGVGRAAPRPCCPASVFFLVGVDIALQPCLRARAEAVRCTSRRRQAARVFALQHGEGNGEGPWVFYATLQRDEGLVSGFFQFKVTTTACVGRFLAFDTITLGQLISTRLTLRNVEVRCCIDREARKSFLTPVTASALTPQQGGCANPKGTKGRCPGTALHAVGARPF